MILDISFSERQSVMDVLFQADDPELAVDFGELQRLHPVYCGPYTVTPSACGQVLDTAGKLMEENTRIKAIPFYNVGNPAGGSTIYIGKEIEIS